jgi:hypothetical protein
MKKYSIRDLSPINSSKSLIGFIVPPASTTDTLLIFLQNIYLDLVNILSIGGTFDDFFEVFESICYAFTSITSITDAASREVSSLDAILTSLSEAC